MKTYIIFSKWIIILRCFEAFNLLRFHELDRILKLFSKLRSTFLSHPFPHSLTDWLFHSLAIPSGLKVIEILHNVPDMKKTLTSYYFDLAWTVWPWPCITFFDLYLHVYLYFASKYANTIIIDIANKYKVKKYNIDIYFINKYLVH